METLPAYGLQFCIDGYDALSSRCDNESVILSLLKTLPVQIGMRPLGEPQVVRVTETGIAGLSGFTFIMESHISIHTYAEWGFVTVDIYSCKPFITSDALHIIRETFGMRDVETYELVRGKRFGQKERAVIPP